MLTELLKHKHVNEYKAPCGCVVRLFPSPPPMSNLTTMTYCEEHQPREREADRDRISDEARSYFQRVTEPLPDC